MIAPSVEPSGSMPRCSQNASGHMPLDIDLGLTEHVYVYVYVYIYIYVYVCVCVYIFICVCIDTCINLYEYND